MNINFYPMTKFKKKYIPFNNKSQGYKVMNRAYSHWKKGSRNYCEWYNKTYTCFLKIWILFE